MASDKASRLRDVQYGPERDSRRAIESDDELMERVHWARRTFGVHTMRQRLLSTAVRINKAILPALDAALRHVSEASSLDLPMEAYVYAAPDLNAAVIPADHHMMVLLSSAAIEKLSKDELDFVIGHELGHAAYEHLDFPAMPLVSGPTQLKPRHAMQLMAWQRKAEISADRAGLVCCGSMEIAAHAMFKTLSGLTTSDVVVDPLEYAGQWNELAAEIMKNVSQDHWMSTHPFPPLRMHAMLCFSRTSEADLGGDGQRSLADVDSEIERMLGMIDPLARDAGERSGDGAADPLLRDFFLWGGMYIAAADGEVATSELENLATLVGQTAVEAVIAEGLATADEYRRRFREAREQRRNRLTALEIQRIFTGLAAIAKADGIVVEQEIDAMQELARAVGISDGYVQSLL